MTTTKKAVDPNDLAPIRHSLPKTNNGEFSDSVYMRVGLGATRAPCPWPVRTREEMQRTRSLFGESGLLENETNGTRRAGTFSFTTTKNAKHIHIRTRRAQASHAQTDSLQVQRALSAFILVSHRMSVVHTCMAEKKSWSGRDAFPSRELSLSGSSRCRSQPPSTRRVGSGKLHSTRGVSLGAHGVVRAQGLQLQSEGLGRTIWFSL